MFVCSWSIATAHVQTTYNMHAIYTIYTGQCLGEATVNLESSVRRPGYPSHYPKYIACRQRPKDMSLSFRPCDINYGLLLSIEGGVGMNVDRLRGRYCDITTVNCTTRSNTNPLPRLLNASTALFSSDVSRCISKSCPVATSCG